MDVRNKAWVAIILQFAMKIREKRGKCVKE